MIWPAYKMKRNGVPVLSRAAIDEQAQKYITMFCPEICSTPAPVPIEDFLERYLEVMLDYQYLSNDGRYLGMTVFTDCLVPVWDPIQKTAEPIRAKAGTILIDNFLLEEEGTQPRYRFTLAHEAGHFLYHRTAYRMLEDSKPRLCPNSPIRTGDPMEDWSDSDWLEWQADTFASCFLLPRPAVQKAAENWKLSGGGWGESLGTTIARIFNVSHQAAIYRLQDLGIPDEQRPFKSTLTDDMYDLEPDDEHGNWF